MPSRYAVVTIWREVKKHQSNEVAQFFRKCDGKLAAVAAARELLAEHSAKFDQGISIDSEVFPEGEWAAG